MLFLYEIYSLCINFVLFFNPIINNYNKLFITSNLCITNMFNKRSQKAMLQN